mgnify:CR=1 FL=1
MLLTGNPEVMGRFANGRRLRVIAWTVVALIVALAGLSLGYGTAWQVPAVSAAHTLGLLALAAFLVFLFFLVVVRVLRSEERQLQVIVESLTVALVALVMLAPTIRFWYILWFLPLAALVVSGRRWTNILAVSSVLGSITVLPDGNSAVSEDMALPMVLLAVAVVGDTSMGAQRWLNLGFVRLQPSEIMKIGIVLGSIRDHRKGESVARWALDNCPAREGVDVEIIDVSDTNIISALSSSLFCSQKP